MDIKDIEKLLRLVAETGVSEISLEQGEEKITISNKPEFVAAPMAAAPAVTMAAPAPTPIAQAAAPAPAVELAASSAAESSALKITSPMVGTFYRAPSPDAKSFIEVGDKVTKGQVIGIIEAMKLMNEVTSEHAGVVKEIVASNAQPVEFGQVLVLVE